MVVVTTVSSAMEYRYIRNLCTYIAIHITGELKRIDFGIFFTCNMILLGML